MTGVLGVGEEGKSEGDMMDDQVRQIFKGGGRAGAEGEPSPFKTNYNPNEANY